MVRQTELVSQWQEQLSAAEEFADGTPRFRWLHAARVRLYRFLLRCYGSGQWRSAVNDEMDPLDVEPAAAAVATQDEATQWHGKPAKTAGKIQAVLKSVHNAQDREPQRGPLLAGGIDSSALVAVTSAGAKIDVRRCKEFLRAHGIDARVVGHGRERTVEVPYADLHTASALVDANRDRLRLVLKTTFAKLLRHESFVPRETQVAIVGLLLLAWMIAISLWIVGATLVHDLGTPYDGIIGQRMSPLSAAGMLMATLLFVAEGTLLCYLCVPRRWPVLSIAMRRHIVAVACCVVVAMIIIVAIARPLLSSSLVSHRSFQLAIGFVVVILLIHAADYWLFRRLRG